MVFIKKNIAKTKIKMRFKINFEIIFQKEILIWKAMPSVKKENYPKKFPKPFQPNKSFGVKISLCFSIIFPHKFHFLIITNALSKLDLNYDIISAYSLV
jgi:hypothetical protein